MSERAQVATEELEVSAWDEANFFQKWTFQAANKMLDKGTKKTLEFEDMLYIPDRDKSEVLLKQLKHEYIHCKAFYMVPRLMVAIFRMSSFFMVLTIIGTLLEGLIRIALPLVLVLLLSALQDSDDSVSYRWAAIIAALGLLQAIVHHILFFFSMRMGWNWKTACTAFIYDTLFKLEGTDMQAVMTGQMVNMISNDVSRLEEFSVVSSFLLNIISLRNLSLMISLLTLL